MTTDRIPITRHDPDGTVTDGTARMILTATGRGLDDFRDLDGEPMCLPPGAAFHIAVAPA